MKKILVYVKVCYWIGIVLDAISAVWMYRDQLFNRSGLASINALSMVYLENAGIGAAFMLAWTILLFWASRRPVERRGVLLITAFPVLAGIMLNYVQLMLFGYITHVVLLVLLVIYIILIGLFSTAYVLGGKLEAGNSRA